MLFAASLAVLAPAAGCGPGGEAANVATDAPPSGDQGYAAPPELTGAVRIGAGQTLLTGRASPAARVGLATPAGEARFTFADPAGVWRLTLPAMADAQLFGLSMASSGRVTQAQGYLFLAPDGAAARLRAGGGTESLTPDAGVLAATALDYDGQRAATLSGRAAAGETVTLRVDGVERGQAIAGANGRFVLPLNQPLDAGAHDFDLAASSGQAHLSAVIAPPARLAGARFRASRTPVGWRIDWPSPGGGEQTTLVIDAPEPPH
jgi:hypothetical protein